MTPWPAHSAGTTMAGFAPAVVADLSKQNETLIMANLQLEHEVNTSKKHQFKHEILAKQLEAHIKELEATIKTQAAEIASWATQVDQILGNVSGQIEEALNRLRARPTGVEASRPQSILIASNQQRANPAPHGEDDPFGFLRMASKVAPDMNPTHPAGKGTYRCDRVQEVADSHAVLKKAILARNPEPLLTHFGKPNEQNLAQPPSVVYAETKSSMRPESAPFVPSVAVKQVKSPFDVFRGSLEDSIHAIPRINRPANGGVHSPLSYDEYDSIIHGHVDHWLEGLTSPSKAVERTQWSPRLQLSSTAPEGVVLKDIVPTDVVPTDVVPKDVVPKDVVRDDVVREGVVAEDVVPEDIISEDAVLEKHDGSLGTSTTLLREYRPSQAKPYIYLGGTPVKIYSPKTPQHRSKAERTKPLSSELKVDQSIHPQPQTALLSKGKTTDQADRPIITQISSVNLPQAAEKRPTPDDSVNVELSDSSSQELGPLIPVGLPTYKEDRDVIFSALPSSDPFPSLLDSQSDGATVSKYQALWPTEYKTASPRPSAALASESLAPNSSKQSPAQMDASLNPNRAEASPANSTKDVTPSKSPVKSTHKGLLYSESLPAVTHNILAPSESSLALNYKVLDDAKPSHILYEEIISASNAFSEKTEAQRKAAMDHKPAEEEVDSVEVEVSVILPVWPIYFDSSTASVIRANSLIFST